jgi:hypothetical protein
MLRITSFSELTMHLQKISERSKLCRQEEGNLKYILALGETLADAFLLGEGVSHGNSVRMESEIRPNETGKRKPSPPVRSRQEKQGLRLPVGDYSSGLAFFSETTGKAQKGRKDFPPAH